MDRIFFHENLSDETLAELDDFLCKHPQDTVNYCEWRTALKLHVKVLQELVDSVKEFGERVDEILEGYKNELECDDPIRQECARYQINRELGQIAVVPNIEVENKLKMLCKKHY